MSFRVTLTPGWKRGELMLQRFPREFPIAVKRAILQEAHFQRNKMIGSLSNGWPPHSRLTLIIRQARGGGGRKMLVESAGMRNAITVVPVAGGAFVGVKRGRQSRGGKDVVNIAQIHHTGSDRTQVMSDRQRRFIFAMLKKAGKLGQSSDSSGGGGNAVRIRLPARPFIARSLARHATPAQLRKRLRARVSKNMNGLIGV